MKHFPESEFIINADGSVFHLHLQPEQLRDKIILVGDPGRVDLVASSFEQRVSHDWRYLQGKIGDVFVAWYRDRQYRYRSE